MLQRLRRTKIVTTLGPATDQENIIEKIIIAGANVMRLNFSHGTASDHQLRAERVRKIANRLGHNIAILGDLQGPKIRISKFKDSKILLKIGDKFALDANLNENEGTKDKVGIDYKNLPNDVVSGDILLLDDGRIQLKVIKVDNTIIFTRVLAGGFLSNNKGINKLHGGLSAEILTKKDKLDIIMASKINVDYLAISFPRCGKDINYARYLSNKAGCNAKLVAKIERAETVTTQSNIDDIILASDAIMIARGDLGVEIGDPELVGIQKNLIRRARQLNRIIITATQMMESMINNPMPTRAEVMDVANAVLDGTDAVMLSAETAVGNYPEETVSIMAKVCLGAEKVPSVNVSKHRLDTKFKSIEEAIAMSAMYTANHLLGVTAIITMTESGRTPLITSRITSGLPIFAMSRHIRTLNLTSMYRGVTPVLFISNNEGVAAAYDAINLLLEKKYLVYGDLVIVTQGDVMGAPGTTNTNRVLRVI
ncbi:pyruvate kinase [Candidatus Pantoea edessiphila]|uniref:Pyruvate kinase n=1 Tax=Candidatus Pantoea edessiphila TaxID=2044610 RepID=A0A2P5SYN0_9GAMM|nr:pyruvate kinase [Candidatus Pantoea edessiphila]MBK4775436.1 pyruvate kinase [Pantoea sp. Edef]PPI87435.1 pyruvate kinase [Candidatus Pantoea edessiphila]